MWFSIYAHHPLYDIDLYTPIPSVYFILPVMGDYRLLVRKSSGQQQATHQFSSLLAAQRYAADRYRVQPGMWANSYTIHPLEQKPHRRQSQLYYLARVIATACRPSSILDYAVRMSYDTHALLDDFAQIRKLADAQISFASRHAFALPYLRQAILRRECPRYMQTLYRTLTLSDEADAQPAITETEQTLYHQGLIPMMGA
jgi:hypothetical protein